MESGIRQWHPPACFQESMNSISQNNEKKISSTLKYLSAVKFQEAFTAFRHRRLFGVLSLAQLATALRYSHFSELRYQQNPTHFSSLLNFALVTHFIRFEYTMAEELYKTAISQNGQLPLLQQAFALLLLSLPETQSHFEVNENAIVRKKNKIRAYRLLQFAEHENLLPKEAESETTFLSMMDLEPIFLKFALFQEPGNEKALLNYALFHQCISHDYHVAERYYDLALKTRTGGSSAILLQVPTITLIIMIKPFNIFIEL